MKGEFHLLLAHQVGFSGVCGVVTYVLEVPPDEEAEYIQIMFSIPYNLQVGFSSRPDFDQESRLTPPNQRELILAGMILQIHSAYFAIGVSEMFMNTSDLFSDLYYYAGAFQRGVAGKMVQFSSERSKRPLLH